MNKPILFDVYITGLSPTEMTTYMRNRHKFTHYFAGEDYLYQWMKYGKCWRKVKTQHYCESLTCMTEDVIRILMELK